MEVVPKYWWIKIPCKFIWTSISDIELDAPVMHFLDYPNWEVCLN